MKLCSPVLFICTASTLVFLNVASAYSCAEITNQIHKDIATYSYNIQNRHLSWMQLSWLKKQLGKPEKNVLSANEVQYSWKCPDDESNFLFVTKTKAGELTKFSGQYSSEEGSGSFSLDKKAVAEQMEQIIPGLKKKPLKQTASTANIDLVKQISNDLEEYS